MKNSIIFCEYIDSNNTPLSPAKTFELGPAGVNVKFFLPDFNKYFSNGCKKFIYEIFKITEFSEEYEDAIFAEINPSKKIQAEFTFFKSGKFRVKIYDSKKKNLLNSGTIIIKNTDN
ncbi:MAG: hypothetical protein J0M18_08245 [Ignavibacteria bacterium]|nr:hypothetical protein [Ignavibacteria bacterium]